jgi:starvation-inducible DNA-binding protein
VELHEAVDTIAERVRSLGAFAPGTYAELARLSAVPEEEDVPGPEKMIRRLAEAHEALARRARPLVAKAEEAGDVATADLVIGRIAAHEKTVWMLRSSLGSSPS